MFHFKALVAAVALLTATAANAQSINGAGATFPAPLYAKWAADYKAATGKSVNYQSVGSGAGLAQVTARTVDFGASDQPQPRFRLTEAKLIQFPTVVGGIVPIVNLPGIKEGDLRFDAGTLSRIYEGKITQWNDPAIVATNPGRSLPDSKIVLVRRSDSSGTTFHFTAFLDSISNSFRAVVGVGTSVRWPSGSVGGRGNEGVAATVKQTPNSIGYVEFSYAEKSNLAWTLVRNADGNYPRPSSSSFAAAAAGAAWSASNGFNVVLANRGGSNSWPITAVTYILVPTDGDANKTKEVLGFFDWAMKNGDRSALALDYVPIPDSVSASVRGLWRDTLGAAATGF